jgi:hypothetical protein
MTLHLFPSVLHSRTTNNIPKLLRASFKIILISQLNEFIRLQKTFSKSPIRLTVVEAAAIAKIPNLNLVAYLHKKLKLKNPRKFELWYRRRKTSWNAI